MYKDFKKSESLDTGFVGGSGIIWMFSGIVLGLLFGLAMYYFSNDKAPRISVVDSLQKKIEGAQASQPQKVITPVAKPSKIAQLKPEQKKAREHKFSYYAVLPTLDVPVGLSKPINTQAQGSVMKVKSLSAPEAPLTVVSQSEPEEISKKQSRNEQLGDYMLQVASFKKQSMANKTKGSLSNKGIDAYIQKKKIKGRFWYRVVAGPVDQHSVDNWKTTAEQLGHSPLVISVR